ncbi:hypothetical protein HQ535_02350 [bacterium]|nr:hypothetical protein [bacterium]
MSTRYSAAIVLLLLLLTAACDGGDGASPPPSTATSSPASTTSTTVLTRPEVKDPLQYANDLGISVEEAERRNQLVALLEETAFEKWFNLRTSGYAGMWVEETSEEWRLVVARRGRTQRASDYVDTHVAGTPLAGLIEVRQVSFTLEQLETSLSRLQKVTQRWCFPLPTSIRIDEPLNRVVIGVRSLDDFMAALEPTGARLGNELILEERPGTPPAPTEAAPCEDPLRMMESARRLWDSHDLSRYSYHVRRASSWSIDRGWQVDVWDGQITYSPLSDQSPGFWSHPDESPLGPMERVFEIVESEPAKWMTAIYDPERGFPARLQFDIPGSVDEEWNLVITGFRILTEAPEPVP